MSLNFSNDWKNNWALVLACIVALIAAYFAIVFSGQPLLEFFGFRQTQTALTSYWMLKEGWVWPYQTPVAGYPWAIPFEFPIYQSITAFISWLFNTPLDNTGRLVSFCFLLACAWPALQITKRLNLPSQTPWLFCALLWSSPLYLIWGRTFMIETAALFFIFAAIPYALDLRNPKPQAHTVVLFILFATLGLLQKVTTALPVMIVMSFVVMILYINDNGLKIPSLRYCALVFLGFSIPLIVGFIWTSYTDTIKMQNTLGMRLTAEALTQWNFGTLAQRLDLNLLKKLFLDRIILKNAAGFLGLLILVYAFFSGDKKIKFLLLVGFCLFTLPVYLFINLHAVHDYYQTANALFLIASLAIALVLLPKNIIPIATFLVVFSNYYFFAKDYNIYIKPKITADNNTVLAVADVIKHATPKDSGIVVFGLDWSSELAYYAERKTFAVPEWLKSYGYEQVWENPKAFIGAKGLGALVFCETSNHLTKDQIMNHPMMQHNPNIYKIKECFVWLSGEKITKSDSSIIL